MTYDEYKEKWQKICVDTMFYSTADHWLRHPLFKELEEDEQAKAYVYGLLAYEELSWVTLALVCRLWPNMEVPKEYYGVATKLRDYYLFWIESNS